MNTPSIKSADEARKNVWQELADALVALIPEEARPIVQAMVCEEFEEMPYWLDQLIENTLAGYGTDWLIRARHLPSLNLETLEETEAVLQKLADAWKGVIDVCWSADPDEIEVTFYATEYVNTSS